MPLEQAPELGGQPTAAERMRPDPTAAGPRGLSCFSLSQTSQDIQVQDTCVRLSYEMYLDLH